MIKKIMKHCRFNPYENIINFRPTTENERVLPENIKSAIFFWGDCPIFLSVDTMLNFVPLAYEISTITLYDQSR